MKPSDFVSTSGQKQDVSQSLLQTELTDAVNSGLVGRADKSEKSLKSALYSVGKKSATGGATSAALAAATRGIDRGSESSTSTIRSSAVNGALSDSELEGADTVYYGGKGAYRAVRGVQKRLAGKDPLSTQKSLGKLTEKKSQRKIVDTLDARRKAQAKSYFKKTVYNAAEKAKAAAVAEKAVGGKVLASKGGSGLLMAVSAPTLPFLIIVMLAAILFLGILSGVTADEARKSIGSLVGVPAEVASILKGYGYTNEAIAAILGNMQQESSMNPGTAGDDGYGTASVGLIQLSGSNKNAFLRWCANNGKVWNTVSAQMEWSFSGKPGTGYFIEDWSGHLATSYYELEDGYEARFGMDYYRSGEELKTSVDVDLATYSFMACHERCGSRKDYGDDVSRLDKRLEYAHTYLAQINTGVPGGGQDYASAEQWQKDIVDACGRASWPGPSLCATWTSRVYAIAGHPCSGNGNSVLGHQGYGASYYPSRATTDLSQIKVGMLVSAQFGSNTAAGNAYGHVGIYIGDGMVMDSVSSGIRTISLSEWVSQNGRGWVVCGYPWDWR